MTIRLAEHSGFCFGVRRAIQMAVEAQQCGGEVCTWGELIHNPQIVADLARQGIGVCSPQEPPRGKTVVLRSHGVSKNELELLQTCGNTIVDATCPYVERAQELVAANSGHPLLILGDPGHPEVQGMLSYGNHQTRVIRPGEELGDKNWKTLSVVCQTTLKLSELQQLVHRLLPQVQELRVFNTICSATSLRQSAAVALARRSELMIVIGGRNSSNTRMLHELCSAETRCLHIETEAELTPQLLAGAQSVGLAAGASTPADRIVKVFNTIKQINGEAGTASSVTELPLFKEESC